MRHVISYGKIVIFFNSFSCVEMADRTNTGDSPNTCKNIKSKRNPKERCSNPATHDGYCGVHFRAPNPWTPMSPENIAKRVAQRHRRKRLTQERDAQRVVAANRLQTWFRRKRGIRMVKKHGIAYFHRSLSVNDTDFFSTDRVADISGTMFFSYVDANKHVYAFDIRSLHMLLYKARTAGEICQNPFTREPFPDFVAKKVKSHIQQLQKRNLPTEWAPLEPPTPEQQWRMKVVDIFTTIDSLNYYSSPDWFISLNHHGQRTFYTELYGIWSHRAGLSIEQKNTIVPNYIHRMFRHPPWAIGNQPIQTLQKLNMNCMKLMISSAVDRNDRILGAMYVITALTMVSPQARTAYPWLHESIRDEVVPVRNARFPDVFGIGWLNEIFNIQNIPPLALPPPNEERTG